MFFICGASGDGKDMAVQTYMIVPTWTNTSTQFTYETVPSTQSPWLRIDILACVFFGMAANHHFFVWAGGSLVYSVDKIWVFVDTAFAWWRWLEYAISAPAMIVVVALMLGIAERFALINLAALMFLTIVFGFLTELYATPLIVKDYSCQDRYKDESLKEKSGNHKVSRSANLSKWQGRGGDEPWCYSSVAVSAGLRRLLPHFFGWIPFLLAWAILITQHVDNTNSHKGEGSDEVPYFVHVIVYGTFASFLPFPLVQIAYVCRAPKYYWQTEVWYCVLSLTSKMLLGGVLLTNVLVKKCFAEGAGYIDECF